MNKIKKGIKQFSILKAPHLTKLKIIFKKQDNKLSFIFESLKTFAYI